MLPCLGPCSGPREDATRIGSAGVVRRQAVDVSPLRRVNQVRDRGCFSAKVCMAAEAHDAVCMP